MNATVDQVKNAPEFKYPNKSWSPCCRLTSPAASRRGERCAILPSPPRCTFSLAAAPFHYRLLRVVLFMEQPQSV